MALGGRRPASLTFGKTAITFFNIFLLFNSCSRNGLVCLAGWLNLAHVSKSEKLLGVHLDDALSFDEHVSKVVTSCYLVLRNLLSIRKFLTVEAAASIVHAFVSSRLDMCNSLFLGMSASNMAKLQHVLDFAIRLVKGRSFWYDTSQLYHELHWLTVPQRVHFKRLVLVFRCINSSAPSSLADLLRLASPAQMNLQLGTFHPSSQIGRRAFSYLALRCWNALPRQLRIIPHLDSFKDHHLNHHLVSSFHTYLHNVDPYTSTTYDWPLLPHHPTLSLPCTPSTLLPLLITYLHHVHRLHLHHLIHLHLHPYHLTLSYHWIVF